MMIDSISAVTSIIGCGLFCDRAFYKDRMLICSQKVSIVKKRGCLLSSHAIKCLSMALTKEEARAREGHSSHGFKDSIDTGLSPSRLWPPSSKADNISMHNPLLRQERLGCGWLGVIFEWEGVIVEDDYELERQAWLVLAQEEGKSPLPVFLLRRIEGMKNEQAISEVLCWSRDSLQVCRLASRKEEIKQNLQGGFYQIRPGSQEFVSTLMSHRIPIAVASTRPRRALEEAMKAVGLQNSFDAVAAAEDVRRGRPDPEMLVFLAQLLNFIPERCIVVGNSNSSVEAAHDARMKCVAVAGRHLLFELGAADIVVRRLDELSVVDLKNLAALESPEFESFEVEMEL